MKNKTVLYEYGVSAVVAFLATGGLYLAESTISGEVGLRSFNVALAASTLVLLGIVLLLGPLTRMFDFFDTQFRFRKELGIMAFFTGLSHVYIAMFPLARSGPWGLFLSRPLSAYSGFEALIILFFLFIISFSWAIRALGSKLWWRLQYWGARCAFLLIVVHMVALKQKTIINFVAGSREGATPLILWEALFAAYVMLVRFAEISGKAAGRIIVPVLSALTLAISVWFVLV